MKNFSQPTLTQHVGKGSKTEKKPSRHAMSELVAGNPAQRSMGNYSKVTPVDAGKSMVDMAAQYPKRRP